MKSKILTIIFAISFYQIIAQVSINNYVFTTSNSGSLARSTGSLIDDIDMTTGTTVVLGGSAVTNTTSSAANLNFDFYSGGARFTNFTVTPNGWVGLGGGVSPAVLWSATAFSGTRIAPFLGPLLNTNVPPLSSMTTSSIGRIHYKLIGTSPSRVGVIEFLRMSINSSVVDDTTTFQVRLYESNGAIEMVYGRMKVTAGAPLNFNVGFKIASGAHSVNASNNTSSTSTTNTNTFSSNTFIPNLHNYTNGSQRLYRFIPNPPNDPTNFTISNITNNAMTLNWTDASNETGYVLYRSLDGGSTYTFVTQLAANVVTYNATGLPANTDVYWRLFSLRESLGTQIDNLGTTLGSSIITSVADGNWNNTATWSSGTIPTANDSVLISATDTVTVNINNATCNYLSVDGALHYAGTTANTLNIMTNLLVNSTGAVRNLATSTGNNIISVGGASTASTTNGGIINNGIIDLDNGNTGVTFNMFGNGNATISGSPTLFQLRNLQLQKNNNVNNIVEVFTPFTVAITTNTSTLLLNSGTLKLSCAINLTPYGNTFGSTIVSSINAKLWLNHGGAVINTTTTPPGFTFTISYTLQGELQIDSGTLNIGYGNSNLVLNNAFLRMNGGTINILGGFSHNNTGTFIMTGGNININPISGANALPAATAALLFGATANVTWTGGTINVINPQTLNNNVSVNILSGGTKNITGGILKIGNGLQNGTGASAINTAGFGLTSQVPLYNVWLDCRYDLSTGRLARIVGTFIVGNALTISTGTSLLPASGNNGGTLVLKGNLINNGTVIGNFPIVSAPRVGAINFEGTTNQSISGAGSFSNLANLNINNPNGVTSTSTNFGNVIRLNLLTGLLTTNGSLVIGATISRGTIQVGGLDELTAAGSLSSAPLFNPTFATHNFIYGPSSTALSIGANNEMATGSLASVSNLIVLDQDGLNSTKNIIVLDTLNLGSFNLNINNNSLTIGSSITQVGRLIRTSGNIKMDSAAVFGRWYATGSVLDNTLNSGFPILSKNQDRSVTVNSDGNGLTTGGLFTVKHSNINGNTNLSTTVTDGSVIVNRISNSNWIFNNSGITVPSFYGLQVNAQLQGIGAVNSLSELRWMKPTLGSGATSTGVGTLTSPIISRLFSQTQVAAGTMNDTFHVGVNTSSNTLTPTYIAISNGSWDNPNTWNNNSVPNIGNVVIIPSPYTVNLNTSVSLNEADSLAILNGGKLTIHSNTLTVNRNVLCDGVISITGGVLNINGIDQAGLTIGANDSLNISGGKLNISNGSNTNRTLMVNGIINISDSGEINMNGNVVFNAGSTLIQTGGDLNIDGNSGIAFTSLLSGKHLLDINTSNLFCSAGNITFIDPPHSSLSALSTYTLRISATSNLTAFSGTHTFIFGNGTSTTAGNSSGFNVDNRKSGIVPIQNIIVNGGSTTGRWLSPSYSSGSFGLYALGNLTINTGSELRQSNASQLAIGGNITNNGILTSAQTFTVGGLGYNITNAQTIGGSGIFRNNATTTTAEFTTLVLNNGGTSINLGSSTLRIATALNLVSGQVNAGTNVLKIPATAALNRTNGYITAGGLELNFALGTNVSKTYFVGSTNGYTPTILTFPSVTTQGDVRLTLTNADHVQISAGCIDNTKSINKNWNINNISVLPYSLNADLSYVSGDIDAGTTISNIIGKNYNGSSWSNITLSSVSGTNTLINGIASNGEIQLGEANNPAVSVSISANNNPVCIGTNVTFTAIPTNGGISPVYQWKKNGTNVGINSTTYSDNALANNDTITCIITSNIACVSNSNAVSNIVIMSINSISVGGTISGPNSVCSGSSAGNLTLTGAVGSVTNWEYSVSPFNTWTTISNTSTVLSPGIITQNTKYRALVQNSTCGISISDTATIVLNNTTIGGTVTGGTTICSGATSGLLTLSGNTGSVIRWESSVSPFSTWTSVSNTTSGYVSGALSETTQFRAVVQSGTCASVNSIETTVTVNPSSVGGSVVGSTTICSGNSGGTLGLFGNTGNVIRWESSISPFTSWSPISNTSNFIILGNLTDSTKYRAVIQSGSCAIAYSSIADIDVSPSVVAGTVNGPSTICSGSNPGNLVLSGNVGNVIRWESAVSPFTVFSTISNTTNNYSPGVLTQTTHFRAVVQSGSCGIATTNSLVITISSSVVGGNVSAPFSAVCSGVTPTQRISLTGFSGSVTTWQSATGSSPYTWSNISGSANLSSIIPSATTANTAYRALVSSGSCGSAVSDSIVILVNAPSVGGTLSSDTAGVCPNSNATLTLTGNTGNIIRWETAFMPYSSFVIINSTNNPFTTSFGITNNTLFYAIVKNGVCPEIRSTPEMVAINNNTSWIDPNNGTSLASWHDAVNWTCGVPNILSNVSIQTTSFGSFPAVPKISTIAYAKNISLSGGGPGGGAGSFEMLNGSVLNLAGNLVFNVASDSSRTSFVDTRLGTINLTASIPQVIYTTPHTSGMEGFLTVGSINVNGPATKRIDSKVRIINNLNLVLGSIALNDSLIIDTAGSISGGSSSSYILSLQENNTYSTGYLIQENIGVSGRTGSINFPVGTVNSYNPITINNIGIKDNFRVRVMNDIFLNYIGDFPNSMLILSNAVNKTWLIREQTPGGSNVTLNLQWEAVNELSGFARANSYIARYNGTTWLASSAGAAAGSGPYNRTLSGITSFSTFGVGSGGTLPVKWIRFNGALANKITNLNWATSSEINNKGFEVERSFNGTDFKNIGFVNGNGNSNAVNNYNFNDNLSTINQQLSTIYYRLKQVDFDGNFEYSNTIAVKAENANEFGNDVTISPNPFINQIQLNFNCENNSTVNLVLVDALGRIVYNKSLPSVNGTNNLTIDDIAILKAGIYFAHLESNGVVTKTVKMLKN